MHRKIYIKQYIILHPIRVRCSIFLVYLIDIGDNISISPTPLKGLHKYSINIPELFWYAKMEIYIFGKTTKSISTKLQVNLHNNYRIILIIFGPWKNSKTELFHDPFQCEKERKIGWDNWLTASWLTKIRARVEKVDMLI